MAARGLCKKGIIRVPSSPGSGGLRAGLRGGLWVTRAVPPQAACGVRDADGGRESYSGLKPPYRFLTAV